MRAGSVFGEVLLVWLKRAGSGARSGSDRIGKVRD